MNKRIIFLGIFVVLAIAAVIWLSPNSDTQTAELAINNTAVDTNNTVEDTDTKAIPSDLKFEKGDFYYGIGTRFNGITKTKLLAARSFSDFIGDEHAQRIVSYSALDVIVLDDNEKTAIRVEGGGGDFTQEQLNLIKTIEYNTNVLIRAEYKEDAPWSGKIEESHWTPYITVTAATLPRYKKGKVALLSYLKAKSTEAVQDAKGQAFAPGKINFTVTKEGTITNVRLTNTCKVDVIDQLLVDILKNAPGEWIPAKDEHGKAVDQDLVFSFANMGC